jgi:periplasmic divalent cation tolerance protein
MSNVLLVLCTFPDADQARQIGTVLVEKQLAACVNLLPGVTSIYHWQGKIEEAGETLAIFKTTRGAWAAFEKLLAELHPYDVPEIVAVEPAAVAEMYSSWVRDEVLP